MKLIQPGNAKLVNIPLFNLPASTSVCGRLCPGCYAHREQIRFPAVLTARQARLTASQQPDFAQRIITELKSRRTLPTYFRVHASGDFYSQAYIDAWHTIATQFPTIGFYAYTKRLADFDFTQLRALPNFVLIDSLHYGGLNYGTIQQAPKNAVICPSHTGAICGQSCTICMDKTVETTGIWFLKH